MQTPEQLARVQQRAARFEALARQLGLTPVADLETSISMGDPDHGKPYDLFDVVLALAERIEQLEAKS